MGQNGTSNATAISLKELLKRPSGTKPVKPVIIPTSRTRIYQEITNERHRQDYLHPKGMGDKAFAVLAEEFGEIGKAIFEEKPQEMRKEIIETAAVCVRWLEELDNQ